MSGIVTKLDRGRLLLTLSKEIYQKDAIMAAAYKITDSCAVLIRPSREGEIEVIVEPKAEGTIQDLEKTASEFCNDVLDQQIRLDLEKHYGRIRELIVEHAFLPIKDLTKSLDEYEQ